MKSNKKKTQLSWRKEKNRPWYLVFPFFNPFVCLTRKIWNETEKTGEENKTKKKIQFPSTLFLPPSYEPIAVYFYSFLFFYK